MKSIPLRSLIWIISILALLGNAAVLLVLLGMKWEDRLGVNIMFNSCLSPLDGSIHFLLPTVIKL